MIQEILSTEIWLIEPQYLKHFLDAAASKDIAETMKVAASDEKLFMFLFDEKKSEGKSYEIQNGVATINIQGPLMKKASGFIARILGIKGMDKIGDDFKAALADDEVEGIFLNVESPGGTVAGTATLADIIYAGRGQKPILAFADSTMTSAAYWIGSSADSVVMADNTTRIGSVGCVAVHQEISKAAEKAGVKFTVFSSGKFKAAGNEFEALSAKDKAYIQGSIDFYKDRFVEAISRNLNVPISSLNKDIVEAKIFLGQQGIDAGIAHEILTKEKALAKLRSLINSKPGRFKKTQTEAMKGSETVELKNLTFLEIITKIQKSETVEDLARLEEKIQFECSRRKEASVNWKEKEDAGILERQTRELCGRQRRRLLSIPAFEKQRAEYDLGRAIGKKA